jgi:hypothetical protein
LSRDGATAPAHHRLPAAWFGRGRRVDVRDSHDPKGASASRSGDTRRSRHGGRGTDRPRRPPAKSTAGPRTHITRTGRAAEATSGSAAHRALTYRSLGTQNDRFGRRDGTWWVTSGSTLRNVPANGRRSNKGDVGVMTVGLAGGIPWPAHLRGAAGRARRTSRAFMTLDARGFVRFGPRPRSAGAALRPRWAR